MQDCWEMGAFCSVGRKLLMISHMGEKKTLSIRLAEEAERGQDEVGTDMEESNNIKGKDSVRGATVLTS